MRILLNGVPLAVAQMRHSIPTLTANTYGHIELIDKAAAVKRLPRMPLAAPAANDGDELGTAGEIADIQAGGGASLQTGPGA